MLALRYLVLVAKEMDDLTKRLFYFLLDRSKGLTEDVCVVLEEDKNGFTATDQRAIFHAWDCMNSSGCRIHMPAVMKAAGSIMYPSCHSGNLIKGGVFGSKRGTSTFWIAREHF